MKVTEAKELVLSLMKTQTVGSSLVSAASPDGDLGKFLIDGKPARAIHYFDGWYVPIELEWFGGSFDAPKINGTAFVWYVFAIPAGRRYRADHYFVCDYLQIREWVLDFAAPLGYDHRDHRNWRADLPLYPDPVVETQGYFRWGDEPVGIGSRPGRVFQLDNVLTVCEPVPAAAHVGTFAPGGEGAAHRLLKLYVASHATEFGLSTAAMAHIEYPFATGDRVDVLFENHLPDRTVVEVEVEGENNVCIGIQQAIKYRSLAAVDAGYPLLTSRVRSLVVAYQSDYPKANELADRYEVNLHNVDREAVLAHAG